MKLVSVVIPSFNEAENILRVYNSLCKIFSQINYKYEFIYVDNCSSDNSVDIYRGIIENDKNVKAIIYSRNFGYQMALKGGLDASSGDCVIFIDGDLQDPPEMIIDFIKYWEEGFKVVYGIRVARKGSSMYNFFYKLFYRILANLSDIKIPKDAGEFGLIDRKLVDLIKNLPEAQVFIRGLRAWSGFRQIGLPYTRQARKYGKTKFNFLGNVQLALNGITSFSNKPLSLVFILGLISVVVAFILTVYTLIIRFFYSDLVFSGWASVALLIIFFGGVQLVSIGVIGEYIGRVYVEVKNRPKYIIDYILNNEKTKNT